MIDAAGRIAALGPDAEVPRPPDADVATYPDGAVLPGLVNAHTHLELTALRGRAPEDDFFEWIQHVRRLKDSVDAAAYRRAAVEGLREAWRHGTTTVADTGTSGAAAHAIAELGGRGIYYHEVIAPDPAGADVALDALTAFLDGVPSATGLRCGVSPHAPYTVSPGLIQRAVALARDAGVPLAMHIAESPAESSFVTAHTGPFAEDWRARGLPLPPQCRSPVTYLETLGVLGSDLLAIHAAQVDREDIAALRRAGAAVAVCPRSNRRHGHGDPPLAALLRAGLRVGLGSDSVASVGTMDLLAEARAARELTGMGPEAALGLATLGGAAVLHMEHEIGSLEAGKWADLCVFRGLAEAGAELAEAVLDAGPGAIAATYVAGRPVYEADGV